MSYRTRKIKRTSKPNVLNNPDGASLLDWLRCYPCMRQPSQARLWFRNHRFTQSELKQAYTEGFQVLALELGYQHRQPLEVLSRPIIASIKPSASIENEAA